MSGGSFEYLCYVEIGDLLSEYRIGQIEEMAGILAGIGEEYAASEMRAHAASIRTTMEAINKKHERLTSIMHAVEWCESCDWGEDNVHKVIRDLDMPMKREDVS